MRFLSLVPVTAAAVLPVVYATAINPDFGATVYAKIGTDLSAKNHYGASTPPWKNGKPGWYYGPNPGAYPGVPCLDGDVCNWLQQFPGVLHCPPKYPPQKPPKNPPYNPPKYPPHNPPKPTYHSTTTKHHNTPKPTYHSTTTKHTTTEPTTTKPTPTPTPTPTPSNGYYPTFSNITAAVQADDYMTFGLVETVTDCEDMCNSVPGCAFVNTYHDVNGKDGSPLLSCSLFTKCHGAEDADNRGGQTQPDGTIDFITDSNGWCKAT